MLHAPRGLARSAAILAIVKNIEQPAQWPDSAAVRRHLSRILQSPGFSSSQGLSKFLQTVIDRALNGQGEQLKESVLGIEVFGRKPGYDPKTDPIVRVQAHRLRTKLANYYEKEGDGDAVRIDIPKGAYQPAFRLATRDGISAPETPATESSVPDRGLVVLPFVNLTGDKENEYFSDGLTEELINALTQVRGLRVVARTSSFAFKGKQQDIREIARALGVEAVLEGGVRRSGSMLRVTVQLVNAADGYQLWGRRYDRRMADVFAIQEDIAQSIVEALKIELTRLPSRPVKTYTRDSEAHHLYLKGRYRYHRWTADNSARAIEFFGEALRRDPNYAPAFSGRADCYFLLGLFGPKPPSAVMPNAYAAAQRAVYIDDTLSEAHCSLGLLAHSYDWDTRRCRDELERSLSLNPGYALARSKYGTTYLTVLERLSDAEVNVKQAVDLDPLSPQINTDLAYIYLFANKIAEAEDQARKALKLDPSYVRAHMALLMSYLVQSRWSEGVEAAEQGLRVSPQSPWVMGSLGWLYGCAGEASRARECEQRLNAFARSRYVSPMWFALIHLGLNEKDRFFEAMNAACDDRAPWLRYIKAGFMFRRFADDGRFRQLVDRLRLEES